METRTKRLGAVIASCAAVGLFGCTQGLPGGGAAAKKLPARYVRVDYRVRQEVGLVPRGEVRAADKFRTLRSTWSEGTAAIRLPEYCAQDSAGRGMGALTDDKQKQIMGTNCGFWLAEIERALVKAKYKVVSWNALNQVERTKNVPTYVAARDLGADFVFLVNSLDSGVSQLGKAHQESFKFFESDDQGTRGQAPELEEGDLVFFKDFVRKRTGILRNEKLVVGIKAVLDMTALDTKTGEAVWFYLKQEAKAVPVALDRKFLFATYGTGFWPALPASVGQPEQRQAKTKTVSSQEETGEEEPTPADAYAAQVNELVRSVVDDFMSRFRGEGT